VDILSEFGRRMKELRSRSGMTQETLAVRSGLDRSYIGSVERGERNISLLNIETICEAFDIDISYFFDEEQFLVHSASLKRAFLKPLSDRFIFAADEEERLMAWQVHGGITAGELSEIGDMLMKCCTDMSREGKVKIFIDFRPMLADGRPFVHSPETMDGWETLQRWASSRCDKVVALCNSKLMQNQLQRQSKRSGIHAVQHCLYEPDNRWLIEQSNEMLGIRSNILFTGRK